MYREFEKVEYAQWAVETMYLIAMTLSFETKILDIAYLLLLKMMKEPSFTLDLKFIRLFIKVLVKQGKYKEALDFIDIRGSYYEDHKLERQLLESDLYMWSDSHLLCLNMLFSILRANNEARQFKDLTAIYTRCIRIVLLCCAPS